MTTDELNAIVKAVMDELEKAGVDFDFKAETPQADDLVYVMRGTADSYQGITVRWQNLLDIIVKKATDAKDEAVSAKDIALQTLATIQGIESNVSSMKSSIDESEANVASMKASVEASEARVTQMKAEAEQTLAEATQTVSGKADKTYVDSSLATKADITYVDGKLANKADKSELAVERARIDSLSTLPEGSTTGDAELIDLRIGADGVTYGNAGTAVRTQISDLKGDLGDLEDILITNGKVIDGYSINGNGGIEKALNNDYCVYCFRVKENEYISKLTSTGFTIAYSFYLEEPTTDTSSSYNNSRTTTSLTIVENIKVPTGCTWIGVRVKINDVVGIEPNNFMFPYLKKKIEDSKIGFNTKLQNTDGKFINNGGIIVANSAYSIASFKILNIFVGMQIKINSVQSASAYCKFTESNDINASPIGSAFHSYDDNIIIPSGAKYLFVSYRVADIKYDDVFSSYYISDGLNTIAEKCNSYVNNIIEVGTNKDFTSLVDAIDSINDSSENNRYTIKIYEGEYETVVESKIGTTDPFTQTEYKGLIIPDYVSIIGIGNRDNIIIKGTLPKPVDNPTLYATNANAISTINLVANGNVENVTIQAENIRYCNHDDGYTFYMIDAEHTFKNVKFVYEKLDQDIISASGGIAGLCVGIGTMHNKKANFERCVFINKVFNKGAILMHDGYLAINSGVVNIINCEFTLYERYSAYDIYFDTNSANLLPCYLNIIGCKLFNGIKAESLDSINRNVWKLFATGNLGYTITKGGGIADVDISADLTAFGNVKS